MRSKDLSQIKIDNIASAKLGGRDALPLRGLNPFRLVLWLTRGNGSVTLSGQTRGINPNTLIYIPADAPYDIHLGQNTHGILIAAPNLNSQSIEPMILNIRQMSEQAQITTNIESIQNEAHSPDRFSQVVQNHNFDLLMIKVQRIAKAQSVTGKTSAAHKLMRQFADLVEENLRQGHGLTWYCSALGVTTAHLSRVCQAENHKPASKYLQDRILSEAQELLLETDLQIAEISTKLHFSTPAYFSRLFTQKIGLTPRDFRSKERQASKRAALARYG